jgi:predicted nuclease of predicted toxin-antitoxin system
MVEPVVLLLNGRGYRTIRARDAGLATEPDEILVDYAWANDLVVVTFDIDLRSGARRKGCRCLYVRAPEITAVERLRHHFEAVIRLFQEGRPLVTLPLDGPPVAG